MGAINELDTGDESFERSMEVVFEHEGGYVSPEEAKRRNDRGGETNFGITKKSYPDLNIKDLTRGDAKMIYYRDYWKRPGFDKLPPVTSFIAFDWAVNSGQDMPVQSLRRAIGERPGSTLTPQVLAKINKMSDAELARAVLVDRINFLAMQSRRDPQFARVWKHRMTKNAQIAGQLANKLYGSTMIAKEDVQSEWLTGQGPGA